MRLLGLQYQLVRTVMEYADGVIAVRASLYRYANDERTQRTKIVDSQEVSNRTFMSLLSRGWIEENDRHAMGVKSRKPLLRAFRASYMLTDKGRAAIHVA